MLKLFHLLFVCSYKPWPATIVLHIYICLCVHIQIKNTHICTWTHKTHIYTYIYVHKWCWWHRASKHIYTSACICISRCIRLPLLPPAMAVLLCDSGGLGWSLRRWPPHRFVGVCLRLSRQFALRSGTSSSSCRKTLSKQWSALDPATLCQSHFRIKRGFVKISFKCHLPWWKWKQFAGSAQVLLSPDSWRDHPSGMQVSSQRDTPWGWGNEDENKEEKGDKGSGRGEWELPPMEESGEVCTLKQEGERL